MSTRADVLTALTALGVPSTCPAIAALAGYCEPSTREALRGLVASGVVVADGAPRIWYLAEWGASRAPSSAENARRGQLRAELGRATDALVFDALTLTPRASADIAKELFLPPRHVALSLSRLRESGRARLSRNAASRQAVYSRGAA